MVTIGRISRNCRRYFQPVRQQFTPDVFDHFWMLVLAITIEHGATIDRLTQLRRGDKATHRTNQGVVLWRIVWDESLVMQQITLDTLLLGLKRQPTAVRDTAVARLAWDDQYLYFAVEMTDRNVWCSYTDRDDPLPREDVIEIFLKPDETSHVYYEFEFSPTGVVFDLRWPRRHSRSDNGAKRYNPRMELAVTVRGTLEDYTDHDEGWLIEGRLPLTELDPPVKGPPTTGRAWRANICRYNYGVDLDKPQQSSWSPYQAKEHGFHRFEYWGELVFQP